MKWLLLALAACGDDVYRNLPYFNWNETRAVGAYSLDHLAGDDAGMLRVVDAVAGGTEVAMFYGHDPPNGTSYEAIEGLLARAELHQLPTFTFADLAAGGEPRPGICLSFDDMDIAAWYALRDLLAAHQARVSFFVTRYTQLTDEQHAQLHELYAAGHSIEAHGVDHLYADAFIPMYGLDAYIEQQIQPSIDVLRADGFAPVAYAHPGGAHTRELDDALTALIPISRSISGRPKP